MRVNQNILAEAIQKHANGDLNTFAVRVQDSTGGKISSQTIRRGLDGKNMAPDKANLICKFIGILLDDFYENS